MKDSYEIAVVHGDGIGPEVCGAAIEVLDATLGSGVLRYTEYPGLCCKFFWLRAFCTSLLR